MDMDPIIYEDLLTEPSDQRRASSEPEPRTRSSLESMDTAVLTLDGYRHRISQLELRIAQDTSQHNDEIGKLHERLRKLESTVEKSELHNQKLEYELTLAQQKFNKEKRKREVNEEELGKQIIELEAKSSELKKKLNEANEAISDNKKAHQHQLERCGDTNRMVEAANMELKKENELLYEEKLAAEQLVVTWKRKHEDLTGKCEVLEQQRQDHTFTIQKLIKDGEYASDLEQELMTKLKDLQERIKTLEENMEAERAAHLETKYNTEVVQLKVRDAEKLLEVEKAKLKECRTSLQDADKKYRDLQSNVQREREQYGQLKIRHTKLKEDHVQLRRELNGKDKHLEGITSDVKNYEHQFNELVKELEVTKEKLSIAEHSREVSRKEMEFLLNNHTVISDLAISPVKDSNWSFSNMTEKMRRVVESYQNKLSSLNEKCKEAAEMLVKLEEECNVHRETAWNKDRALEEAERLVKNAQNNLSKCEIKCGGYEERFARFQVEEKQYKKRLVEMEKELLKLNQKACKNTLDADQQYQNYMKSLQTIYDDLMVHSSSEERNINTGSFTDTELTDMILNCIKENEENTRVIVQKYKTTKEELEKMKVDLHHHKTGIKRLQKLNSQVLTQTEKSLTDSQNLCEREKLKYQDQISVLEAKIKTSTENLESVMNNFQDTPIEEIPVVINKMKLLEANERKNIIYKNIMRASFWGLLYQHHVLRSEKKMILRMLDSASYMKLNIIEMVETLQDEMSDNRNERTMYRLPNKGVFRFRKIAIVVLVVNRLSKIRVNSRTLVLRHKPSYGHSGLLFFASDNQRSSADIPRYSSLIKSLKIPFDEASQFDLKLLLDTEEKGLQPLCTCYSDYLQSLNRSYKKSSVLSLKEDTSESSLMHMLNRGLLKALDRLNRFKYPNSELVVELLRDHILNFTDKLHRTDQLRKWEKSKYKEQKYKYEKEIERLRNESTILNTEHNLLKEQLLELRDLAHNKIDGQQFEDVCIDLKNALQREEELQKLFEQQIQEITQMELRINKHESCFEQQNQNLADTKSVLRVTQMNCGRAEEMVNELRQKVANLKQEKTRLQKCDDENEKKITIFIRDREILARYMRHVTTVIYNAKKQLTQCPDALYTAISQLAADSLQDDSSLNGDKKAPEMQLVENAVNIFFDAQRESLMRVSMLMSEKEELLKTIRSLNDELSAHKSHIRSLRERVSALFQQDFSEDAKNVLMTSMSHGTVFVPLHET